MKLHKDFDIRPGYAFFEGACHVVMLGVIIYAAFVLGWLFL